MDIRAIDKKYLEEQERILTVTLKSKQLEALNRFNKISAKSSLHSFHAYLGCNNNIFVDSVNTKFIDPNDFISRWLQGLLEKTKLKLEREKIKLKDDPSYVRKDHVLIKLLKDDFLKQYLFIFLTRNFYRNFKERVRSKPNENLWSIWFGSGNLVWGLLISPALRSNNWTNDKSEMRRVEYNYWTVRHVIKSGLIDPDADEPITFDNSRDFINFYRSILKRVSNSLYEKQIADRYIDYLKKSDNPYEEPFLIPELRYTGYEKKHKYRLDYAIFNPYTMELTGFEISPSSTHIRVPRIKGVTKVQINKELAVQWSKEMDKRNKYFSKYGVNIITFTDDDLKNIDACFNVIKQYLNKKSERKINIQTTLLEIDNLIYTLQI